MKNIRNICVMICGLLLAVSAFAGSKSSIDLTLNKQSVVNGTVLPAGEYKVILDRDGDNVQATFRASGKTVATTSGHFEQRTAFPSAVAVVLSDSDRAIQQILVKKMNGAVVLANSTEGASAAASH